MAVETLGIYALFNGDGTTTVFPFSFPVQLPSDVAVFYTTPAGVQYSIPLTGFSVTLNPGDPAPGGAVAFYFQGAPAPVGSVVAISRYVPPLQSVEINNQDGFSPSIVTDEFDRLTMVDQQLSDGVARALALPPGDPATGNMILPGAVARAGNTPAFDGNGNLILVPTTMGSGGGGPTVPISAPLIGSSAAGSLVAVPLGAGLSLSTGGALQVTGQALPPNAAVIGTDGSGNPLPYGLGTGLSLAGTLLTATAAALPDNAPLLATNSGGTATAIQLGAGVAISGGTLSATAAAVPANAYITGTNGSTIVSMSLGLGLGATGFGGTLYLQTPLNASLLATGAVHGQFVPVALGAGLSETTTGGTRTLNATAFTLPPSAPFIYTDSGAAVHGGVLGAGLALSPGGTLSATAATIPPNASLLNSNSGGTLEPVVLGTGLALSAGNTLTAAAASFPSSAPVLASSGGSIVGLALGAGLLSSGGTLSATGSAPAAGLVSSNGTILTTAGIGSGLSYAGGTLSLTIAPPAAGMVFSTGSAFGNAVMGTGLSYAAGTLSLAAGAGGVVSISTSGLLTGGPITSTGTIGLPAPAAGVVLSNGSSLSAAVLGSNLSLAGGTLSVNQTGFPVLLHGYSGDGTLGANGTCLLAYAAGDIAYTFPAGLTNSVFKSTKGTATAAATLTLLNNGGAVGTVVFPAGSALGTPTVSSSFTVAAGTSILLEGAAIPDATLAGIASTLRGTR